MSAPFTRREAFFLSLTCSVVLIFVTLMFPSFFFAPPFAAGVTALSVFQLLSTFGWIALIVIPPIVFGVPRPLTGLGSGLLLIGALLWPASVIAIRFALLSMVGNPYLGYLVQYPIFFFSDLLVPALYVVMWRLLTRKPRVTEPAKKKAPASSFALGH